MMKYTLMNASRPRWPKGPACLTIAVLLAAWMARADATPEVSEKGDRVSVLMARMRLDFRPGFGGFDLALRDERGAWRIIGAAGKELTQGLFVNGEEIRSDGRRATWALRRDGGAVTIGQRVRLSAASGQELETHIVCMDDGALLGVRLVGPPSDGVLWPLPRIALRPEDWDRYLYWTSEGAERAGSLRAFSGYPTYAGISPWEQAGDVAVGLDAASPGLLLGGPDGISLGVVFVDYARSWQGAHAFIQRHAERSWLFYPAYIEARRASDQLWAWLAPMAPSDAGARSRVTLLAGRGKAIAAAFRPSAPPVPPSWIAAVPDFPAHLRRKEPVKDIREAVVYTVNETTRTEQALKLAARVGSEVMIRGWFKWAQAPELASVRDIPAKARAIGALFGGGITCSALYDNENGITRDQLLDMATRGPDGQLVDAWGQPGVRHGSLSSPAYLDYLVRWCREQIDAGVDMLFMDEHTAALASNEGFDDHSLADFRQYLIEATRLRTTDTRMMAAVALSLTDRSICPDGTLDSFDYRAYLKARGFVGNPWSADNPLAAWYARFRERRDAAAWKQITERIRTYPTSRGPKVLISANGFAPGVDLQVAGIWDDTMARSGKNDLSENGIPRWRQRVVTGRRIAGREVPVVFFHDWGMGDTPFPFLALSPVEREIWIRVRGAEIYASGGFFAFPVLGPFGCNAEEDGTLAVIQRQAIFYRTHRDLYLEGKYVGCEGVRSAANALGLAVWSHDGGRSVALHVINRKATDGRLAARSGIRVTLPIRVAPTAVGAVSPDWTGTRTVPWRRVSGGIELTLPTLEAYAVARMRFSQPISLAAIGDPRRLRPAQRWERTGKSEFPVRADGSIEGGDELNGFLQGTLHTHLRQPPTFVVNAAAPCKLRLMVRAVATAGARLIVAVDGRRIGCLDLPDRDGKNDGSAPEYNRLVEYAIPAGRHRVTLDNIGSDWLTIDWIEWSGRHRAVGPVLR